MNHVRREDGELGQTAVLMLVFLTVCLSFMAVVIDGGMFYFERRNMQGVADAAALAAVRELPASTTAASSVAAEYTGSRNASSRATVRSQVFSNSNSEIQITVGTTGTSSFGALLGISSPQIVASATARVQSAGAMSGMLPLAFMRDTFTIGTNYEVKFDNNATGNRGAIAPQMEPYCGTAHGATDFRQLIKGRAHGGIDACASNIGSTLDTEPGTMAGPTTQGFDDRIGNNVDSFTDVFETNATTGLTTVKKPNSPRVGIVPVIESMGGTSTWPSGRSQPIRILAYMLVYIGKVDTAGYPAYTDNGKSVWVTPVRAILPAELASNDFASYSAGLPSPVVFRLID